jgi:quinol monooxygenase YgiN
MRDLGRFGGEMAIRLIVTLQAAPGKGAEFAEAFKPQMQITHGEEGCEQYELFRSETDTDKLVLLERWTSQELLDKHLEAMRARGPSPTASLRAEGSTPSMERFDV